VETRVSFSILHALSRAIRVQHAERSGWTLQRLSDSVRQYGGTMSFKFSVGQAVEYTPVGEKAAGLYKVMRQMPEEEQAFDLRYRIKSEAEAYERNVLECQLSSNVRRESEYATTKPRPSQGSHRT
jgi:hypothetical protein